MTAGGRGGTSALGPEVSPRVPIKSISEGRVRFTIDGDDALELHLERTCDRVRSGVRGLIPSQKLEALFLGGGYGRGEGGVFREPAGDQPYNDLEFYVAIRGPRHANEFLYRRRLEVLGEILTQLAGVEIEFKITSLAELAEKPISMFSYDLMVGHRLLWGDGNSNLQKRHAHHYRAQGIPLSEATRLLMNRCSGLLFARAQLAQPTPATADFVRRNVAKAQLACGDAVLVAHGLYHWSCRTRHQSLQLLAQREPSRWHQTLLQHHAAGIEFKLHPRADGDGRDALLTSHEDITRLALQCWLWIESRRLDRAFSSARAYAEDPINKCPGSSSLRNFILNLRVGGLHWHAPPSLGRHPRQRIFHSLALLLWEAAALTDPLLKKRLKSELNMPAHTDDWIAAYRSLWCQVR